MPTSNPVQVDFSSLEIFSTIFLSILIQAFPFLLIGTLISSMIQVFVSGEKIAKLFSVDKGQAFFFAVFAGFLFPVCDCAIIPVAGRLLKKGVPQFAVVTFMLAAPIVNPLVIASTFFAFPEQHFVAYTRIFLGLAVAITVGLFFKIFPGKGSIFKRGISNFSCKCGVCNQIDGDNNNFLGKINAIFKHAGSEFFEVGRFLIVGAFLSGIMQAYLPKDILADIGGGEIISLIIMMLAAFIFQCVQPPMPL